MTDQPIIIDGVDVSKCRYLPYCEDKQGNCGYNPNCYFKQNARKKKMLNEIVEIIRPIANKNPVYNCWTLLSKCDNCSEKEECGKQSPFTAAKQVLDLIDKIKEDKND